MKKPFVVLVPGHRTRTVTQRLQNGCDTPRLRQLHRHDQTVMFDLPKWLNDDGFTVFLAEYQNSCNATPGIEELGGWLGEQIYSLAKKSPTGDVIIICFSLGGFIARSYIDGKLYRRQVSKTKKQLVSKVFMIATPHQGTSYVRLFLSLLIDFKKRPTQVAAQQVCDEKFIRKFNQKYPHHNSAVPYYLIGGFGSATALGHINTAYFWLTQGQNNDGAITVDNATNLKGSFQTTAVQGCHSPDFGFHYFQAPSGEMSDTYRNCIRPVIVENKPRGMKTTKPYRLIPLWAFLVAPIVFAGISFAALIRFVWLRINFLLGQVTGV